jgi:hypothetical protein
LKKKKEKKRVYNVERKNNLTVNSKNRKRKRPVNCYGTGRDETFFLLLVGGPEKGRFEIAKHMGQQ